MESSKNKLSEGFEINKNVESPVFNIKTPLREITENQVSFNEAFKVARKICGPGGWFVWNGNTYNTYYKEEWDNMGSSERNEFLASLDLHHETPKQVMTAPDINLANVNIEEQLDNSVSNETGSGKETIGQVLHGNVEAETITDDGYKIDFVSLYGKNEKTSPTTQNVDSTITHDVVHGELITIDGGDNLAQHEVTFELDDDIEIIVIPDEEAAKLDSIVIDSFQISEFPLNEKYGEHGDLLSNEETINLSAGINAPTSHSDIHVSESVKEESPWGEMISGKANTFAHTAPTHEDTLHANSTVVSNPNEISEYPWGEATDKPVETLSSIEIPKTESLSDITLHPSEQSTGISFEETPWGEMLSTKSDVTIASAPINEEISRATTGVIVSNPNDITEYPWGETIGAGSPVTGEIFTSKLLVEDNVTVGAIPNPSSVADSQETPWGEPINIHSSKPNFAQHSGVEIVSPKSGLEQGGAIVSGVINPLTHSGLHSNVGDVTETPWGEKLPTESIDLSATGIKLSDIHIDPENLLASDPL